MKQWLASLTFISVLVSSSAGLSEGRFTHLAISFNQKKNIEYSTNLSKNTLTILFQDTRPSELENIDQYDERMIRRVVVKEVGNSSELTLFLRDRNIKALVSEWDEPYRVGIDLFDGTYHQGVDPQTGLPLAGLGTMSSPSNETVQSRAGFDLLDPSVLWAGDSEQREPSHTNQGKPVGSARGDGNQRRLLQPMPEKIHDRTRLAQMLSEQPSGRGRFWQSVPFYIYPLQTAAYQGRESSSGWQKRVDQPSPSSAQQMAEYGFSLFSMGDENRALFVYQQVLHHDPSIFEKDPLHLWAFAETHLGQGNLSLADGYYAALISKHPGSAFRDFAKLRRLDIKSLRPWREGNVIAWGSLVPQLSDVATGANHEFDAQVAIRSAYWQHHATLKDLAVSSLPTADAGVRVKLLTHLDKVESKRTYFLAASLILKSMVSPEAEWTKNSAQFSGEYFSRFRDESGEPFAQTLSIDLKTKLTTQLVSDSANGRHLEVVEAYQSLPLPLQSIRKTPEVAWAVAQSYRQLGMMPEARDLYDQASSGLADEMSRFLAYYWVATIMNSEGQNRGRLSQMASSPSMSVGKVSSADQMMSRLWKQFSVEEKQKLFAAYKDEFEKNATSNQLLRTPAVMVLESWQNGNSPVAGSVGNKSDVGNQPGPSGQSVFLVRNLARKFNRLGMKKERRETLTLLEKMKPSSFSDNKEAQKAWVDELSALAEEYRTANQYLEAGRLYTYTATESEDWEKRAEALYKGGLLLYRSGRRQEAIEALTSASQDGNNLFYANLAKERLEQIQK